MTKKNAAESENLDKVRDLLFGAQIKESDKRFDALEGRLNEGIQGLRDDTKKRFDSLEAYVKSEIASVLDRVKSQGTELTSSIKDVEKELARVARALEKRAKEIDETARKEEQKLRNLILEQSKTLRDEIAASQRAQSEQRDKAVAELRDGKADRAALAAMFTELAMQLTGEVEK